ncbi:hypothetical protein ACFL5Z_04105 [Planctomycetota bacterium]
MKRLAGNFLIGLSIVCFVTTVLWIGSGLADMPEELSEKNRTMLAVGLLLAGVFIALEVAMFLCGRYLRRSCPDRVAEEIVQRSPTRPLPLMIYLAGSLGIGILASFGGKVLPESKALLFLIGQPQVLTQLIFGGFLQIKLSGGVLTKALTVAANLLYFPALFYPVYCIATMNRALEVVRYKRMKILLILFFGVHILMAMAIAMLIRA